MYFYRVYYLYSLYQSKIGLKKEKNIKTNRLIYLFIEEKNDEDVGNNEYPVRRSRINDSDKTQLLQSFKGSIFNVSDNQQPEGETHKKYEWVKYWNIINIIGNFFQMIGALISLLNIGGKSMVPTTFIGFGCFCAWFITARYLEMKKKYYELFITIFKSLPPVMYFIISILPIFFGCGMLLCCIFWRLDYFTTLNKTFFTQVGLFLGDLVSDSTEFLPKVSYFWSNVYIYGFIILFMFFAHTILLAIISKIFTKDVSTKFKKAKGEAILQEDQKQAIIKDFKVYEIQIRNTLGYFQKTILKSKDINSTHEYRQFLNDLIEEIRAS